jgi:hypothetical protein
LIPFASSNAIRWKAAQTFVRDQAAGTRKRVGLSGWSRV